jgi:hypothetical protein
MPARLALRSSCAASRDPARPARASAIAVSIRASSGVRRDRREVRPRTCSANVTAGQAGLPQKNRRTASRITTGCPPAGASASRRRYLLCTRAETWPHRPHAALSARTCARMHRRPSASSAVSAITPARCGSSASRLILC